MHCLQSIFAISCLSYVKVVENWSVIETRPATERLHDGHNNPEFCERGTWKLMVAVTAIYSFVLIFRVLTVIGSLILPRRRKD